MRATKVICHVERPCPKCKKPATALGLAIIKRDGRIGAPIASSVAKYPCDDCAKKIRAKERRQYNAERAKRRDQEKWAREGSRLRIAR